VGVGVGLDVGGGVGLGIAGAWLASEAELFPPPQPTSKMNVMKKLARTKNGRGNTLATLILAHAKCDLETFAPNALASELYIFCFDVALFSSSWHPHYVSLSRIQKISSAFIFCSHGLQEPPFCCEGKINSALEQDGLGFGASIGTTSTLAGS
jgi:hypothetical protein